MVFTRRQAICASPALLEIAITGSNHQNALLERIPSPWSGDMGMLMLQGGLFCWLGRDVVYCTMCDDDDDDDGNTCSELSTMTQAAA